jgi:hypothetical protein
LIVAGHVAVGAAAGALLGTKRAVLLGPLLHGLGDRLPHRDIPSLRAEVGMGVLLVAALAARHGLTAPTTLGAIASSAPDLEHLAGRGKLFPSHRIQGWHREGGVPVWAQLLAAGAVLGAVAASPGARSRPKSARPR